MQRHASAQHLFCTLPKPRWLNIEMNFGHRVSCMVECIAFWRPYPNYGLWRRAARSVQWSLLIGLVFH